jgi:hypothetical protein
LGIRPTNAAASTAITVFFMGFLGHFQQIQIN